MARPTLPRLRRGRAPSAGAVEERTEPRISELAADGLTWVHADRPGALEVSYLAERFGFHELDIEDVLSKRQRPKIDEYPDYIFVVLHFPFYDKTVRRLNAAELDVFLGPDFVITLPNVPLLPVTYLFRRCEDDDELREDLFSKGSGYLLYHVLDDLFDYCFPILDKIGAKLDAIEPAIFEERSEDVVRDISNAKQELIAYRKIIKPERATLRLLERSSQRFLPEELEVYYDDIVDASERIWDLLDNYKEVIESLESTNEAFIFHKQQYRLQLLTVVTVILLPLTLLASIFGMNVRACRGEGDMARLLDHPRSCLVSGVRRRASRPVPLATLVLEAGLMEQLWAPWRLEYIQSADEQEGCVFCRAQEARRRGGAGRPPRRAGVRRPQQVPVRLGPPDGGARAARGRARGARGGRGARDPSPGRDGRRAPHERRWGRTGSTSAGTWDGSPARASSTTCTSTSSRAGRATPTSCPSSPT